MGSAVSHDCQITCNAQDSHKPLDDPGYQQLSRLQNLDLTDMQHVTVATLCCSKVLDCLFSRHPFVTFLSIDLKYIYIQQY